MGGDRAWVLLHGTPLTPAVWSTLSPILGEHQPVHAPAVTPRPDDADPQREIARRLAVGLADVADRWDLVGHSFGGQIAIDLALIAPARVASLAIVCSRDTPFPPFAAAAANLRSAQPVDVDGALQRWFRPDELDPDDWLVGYARECLVDADRRAWATALGGIAAYDRSDAVHNIAAPTTLICAELDPVSDPDSMRALTSRLPHARLHLQRGAAHLSPLLRPGPLAAQLLGGRDVRK